MLLEVVVVGGCVVGGCVVIVELVVVVVGGCVVGGGDVVKVVVDSVMIVELVEVVEVVMMEVGLTVEVGGLGSPTESGTLSISNSEPSRLSTTTLGQCRGV